MNILHKSNIIQHIADTEWECRKNAKGMSSPEYWTWLESVTTDGVPDYSGETGYTIVECTDEDVFARLAQLDDYVSKTLQSEIVYNIKWSDTKDTFVMTTGIDGKPVKVVESVETDEDGEVIKTNYKMSHFSGDDSARDARLLADKWANVRKQRNRKLAETDYLALGDNTLSTAMKTYRSKLRSVPQDNSDPDDITWPTKPE